mmetsp:Transcript_108486/g.233678  ORF Transcript_108486/g.233678 Transcript_108486/m.233678 type:complete len:344 (+) Transcript_108486:421-1452(+)
MIRLVVGVGQDVRAHAPELVPGRSHRAVLVHAPAPGLEGRFVAHLQQPAPQGLEQLLARLAEQVRRHLPDVDPAEVVPAQVLHALPVHQLEELVGVALEAQLVEGGHELALVHATLPLGVEEPEGLLGAVPEVLHDQVLEAGEQPRGFGSQLQQADGAAAVGVDILPHGRDVAPEAHFHALPLELLLAELHVRLGVQEEPRPQGVPEATVREVAELGQGAAPLLHRGLAGDLRGALLLLGLVGLRLGQGLGLPHDLRALLGGGRLLGDERREPLRPRVGLLDRAERGAPDHRRERQGVEQVQAGLHRLLAEDAHRQRGVPEPEEAVSARHPPEVRVRCRGVEP